jgi:DNA-damage-inducible protein D
MTQPMFLDNNPIDENKIRRIWMDDEWYFSIVDVMMWATGRERKAAQNYWKNLKSAFKRIGNESVSQPYSFKMPAADGKMRATDFGTAEQILRIVQEIPGAKTDEVKSWLAQIGAERLDEYEDPELALARSLEETEARYRSEGRSNSWIVARIEGIVTRKQFMEALQKAVIDAIPTMYAQTTEKLYAGLWNRTTAQLRGELNLTPKQNPRDHFGEFALMYTKIAERVSAVKLSQAETVMLYQAMEIVWEVAKMISQQAKATSAMLGMDLVTEKPLLPG